VSNDFPGGEKPVRQPDPIPEDLEEFAGIDFLAFDPFLHTGIIMAA
jgi:hypothetical protein